MKRITMRNNWGEGEGGGEFLKNMQNILGNLHRESGGRGGIDLSLRKRQQPNNNKEKETDTHKM